MVKSCELLKMGRVHALAILADVVKLHTSWNHAVKEFPDQTVRDIPFTVDHDPAIASMRSAQDPIPASRRVKDNIISQALRQSAIISLIHIQPQCVRDDMLGSIFL